MVCLRGVEEITHAATVHDVEKATSELESEEFDSKDVRKEMIFIAYKNKNLKKIWQQDRSRDRS